MIPIYLNIVLIRLLGIPDNEIQSVISFCHEQACGGHFSVKKIATKILQSGFYWPTLFHDAYVFFLCVIGDNVWVTFQRGT